MYQERFQIIEQRLGQIFYIFWIVFTFSALMTALFIFQGDIISFPNDILDWLVFAVAFLAWIILVPFLQYLIISRMGGIRPKVTIFSTSKRLRTFGFLETENELTKGAFAYAMAVPIVTTWIGMPLLAFFTPSSSHTIVFAAAVGLTIGLSFRDLWYLIITLRKPAGTMVEELEREGIRFYEPHSNEQ